VVVVVFDVFSVADTVSKADGGTFDGNVTMGGTLDVTGNQTNSGNLTVSGAFTSQGIDDNATSTALTLDSSGNLLVGTTDTTPFNNNAGTSADFGFVVNKGGGYTSLASYNTTPLYINRTSSDGDIVSFRKNGTTVGSIESFAGTYIIIRSGGDVLYIDDNVQAYSDNTWDMGGPSNRWDDVYATNGTIQTSDRNEKQDIEELSDAEKRVAVVAKGLMRKFRWKDKVAEKGDNARTHFGIIAQDLQDAFKAEGLDASDYAMFTSSTWWEKEITVDAVKADEEKGIEAKDAYTYIDTKEEETEGYTEKTRLGVRYSELLAFIISAI
jgi:hypothetical protein